MLTRGEWCAMTGSDKTRYLEANHVANKNSLAKRSIKFGLFINDSHYATSPKISGFIARCPAYDCWCNMIERAYSKKRQLIQPSYAGVSICDEWRSFMNFRAWWLDNHIDGWQIDKDILCDDREYHPSKCIFVPSFINSFTLDRRATRGDKPIGAFLFRRDGKYQAQCNNPKTGLGEHLGLFSDPWDAHAAWKRRKIELAYEMKPEMDLIDTRIHPRIVEIIKRTT